MMASFLSFCTEIPLNTMKSGTAVLDGSRSLGFTMTVGRRNDLGKKGSLPKPGSSTKTDLGPVAKSVEVAGLLSARPLGGKSRQARVKGASAINRRCMVDGGGSGSVGVDQRDDLHFERELFLVALRVGIAGSHRVQFDVLDAHVGEGVFEIG